MRPAVWAPAAARGRGVITASLIGTDGAIAAAKESSDLAIKNDGPNSSWIKLNNDVISSLQTKP